MPEPSLRDNPYAPSGVDPTPEVDATAWHVEGDLLLVLDGAVLPDVPLIGKEENELIRRSGSVRPPSLWVQCAPVLTIPYYLLKSVIDSRVVENVLLAVLLVLGALLLVMHNRVTNKVSFTYVVGRKTLRRRKASYALAASIAVGGLSMMIFCVASANYRTAFPVVLFGVFMVMTIAGAFWLGMLQRSSFQCTNGEKGWASLKGVPDASLRRLADLTAVTQHESSHADG